MTQATLPNRCRIVLIAPPAPQPASFEASLRAALEGGDVASLILPAYDADEASYQALGERIAPLAQERGVAVMIVGDSRVAGRVRADGLHLDENTATVAEAMENIDGKMMVGVGGAKTRDDALALGELRPDYIFFGRFGYDNKPEPHSRNLSLGRWWAEMIQIPCIVMAGSDLASVEQVAETGADFVALSSAVFGEGVDPRAAVERANALLDEKAPRFEG